jgi:hypothetical protein
MKNLESIIAVATLQNIFANMFVRYSPPNIDARSRKSEVIVWYQLLQRISLAYGFVARISSFPVSMY